MPILKALFNSDIRTQLNTIQGHPHAHLFFMIYHPCQSSSTMKQSINMKHLKLCPPFWKHAWFELYRLPKPLSTGICRDQNATPPITFTVWGRDTDQQEDSLNENLHKSISLCNNPVTTAKEDEKLTWFSRKRVISESKNLMILSQWLVGDCWETAPGDLDDFPVGARVAFGAFTWNNRESQNIEKHEEFTNPTFPIFQTGCTSLMLKNTPSRWSNKAYCQNEVLDKLADSRLK